MRNKKKIKAKWGKIGWVITPKNLQADLFKLEEESVQLQEMKIHLDAFIVSDLGYWILECKQIDKVAVTHYEDDVSIQVQPKFELRPPSLICVEGSSDNDLFEAYLDLYNKFRENPEAAKDILEASLKLNERLSKRLLRKKRVTRYIKRKINCKNLDLRKKLRSIQRSLHITTNDGKDADSDLTGNEIVSEMKELNRIGNLLNIVGECTVTRRKNKNYYSGLMTSSPILKAEAA